MKIITVIPLLNILIFSVQPASAEGIWTYYINGNKVNDISVHGDYISCATNGGLVRWNRKDKTYEQHYYLDPETCCGYQRTMFNTVAVDQDGMAWCGAGLLYYHDGDAWTVYDGINDGLPAAVENLDFDRDNVLWIKTSAGLTSFDGSTWTTYQDDGFGHVLEDFLGSDHNNIKWFRTDAGVSTFDGAVWTAYTPDNGLPVDKVYTMSVATDNVKWFTGNVKGLLSFDGSAWTIHEGLEWPLIAIDSNNTIWCGSVSGLAKYDGSDWTYYTPEKNGVPIFLIIRSLAVDEDGVVWIGSRSGSMSNGLISFDGSTWSYWQIDGPQDYLCYDVAVDNDNVKWFCTAPQAGVTSFDGTNWKTYTEEDGLIDAVYRVAVDRDNVKWFAVFGGGGGVMSFNGADWQTYTMDNSGLHTSSVTSIAVDHDNVKWFGDGGVSSFDGTTWTTYYADGDGNPIHGPVAVDSKNVKWFTARTGLSSLDGSVWKHYSVKGLRYDDVRGIAVGKNDVVWINTHNSGVFSFDGTTSANFNRPWTDMFMRGNMAVDSNGAVWFMTDEYDETGTIGTGLTSFDGVNWNYRPDDFWLTVASTRIAIDHDDVKWLVTSEGIVSYNGGPDDNGPTVVTESGIIPDALRIIGNYPNPFNPLTTIKFTLPSSGLVNLVIYNISGQKVRELVSESMIPGTHTVTWDGRDDNGVSVSSGMYLTHIMMGKHSAAGSMVLIK